MRKPHPDSKLIRALGGPAALARTLGYQHGGTQRVANWSKRGIPAQVKLDFPAIFLAAQLRPQQPKPPRRARAEQPAEQGA